jgi:GT2 family glycosyltransferase
MTTRTGADGDSAMTVVMITRNRRAEARRAVEQLLQLPERPPVIVVDNGSRDHTSSDLRSLHDRVSVIELDHNAGASGRNIGARHATTPYVAFADDDSTWLPGALGRAAEVLDAHPRIGLIAGRILVGPEQRLDPLSAEMAASPLPIDPALPGRPVLGFAACGAIVRRHAFLAVGGFDEHYGVGGEEGRLAVALAAAGWALVYVPECVARHWPSPARDHATRRRILTRNDLWSCWHHRRWPTVLRTTARTLRAARTDPATRAGLIDAARRALPELRRREAVEPWLEHHLQLLDAGAAGTRRR